MTSLTVAEVGEPKVGPLGADEGGREMAPLLAQHAQQQLRFATVTGIGTKNLMSDFPIWWPYGLFSLMGVPV
jgi:hypothetical protein